MADKNLLEGYSADDIAAMASAYASIVTNPETREATLRLQKKVNPQARLPEIELADQIKAATKEQQEKIDAQAAKLIQMEAEQRIRDEREKLRAAGFSDADVTAIEAEMIEAKKGGTVLTYESAAKYYKASKTMAVPTATPHVTSMTNELPGDALKAYKEKGRNGLNNYARERAGKALDDILAGRIKLH